MPELIDLPELLENVERRLLEFDINAELLIDAALWRDIITAYRETGTNDVVNIVGNHAMRISTPEDNLLYISSQEFRQIWATLPYARALFQYEQACDDLASGLGYRTRKAGTDVFKPLPTKLAKRADLTDEVKEQVIGVIRTLFPNDEDNQNKLISFLFEEGWSGVTKTLERTDPFIAAIVSKGQWLINSADRRGELTQALAINPEFEVRLQRVLEAARTGPVVTGEVIEREQGGGNHIYYGAPGTGKSHAIVVAIRENHAREIKTVFHPDVQNSDFIGTLKPEIKDGEIGYRFSPGPFLKAYVEAWNNPADQVWFVIEELNRAPAAAVFGELFLLLDRSPDGSGEYAVDYPSPECQAWVQQNIAESISDRPDKLRLPSNLYISCTLNSADQGVYPLDTAFKRRWTQHYVPLVYNGPNTLINVTHPERDIIRIPWQSFIKALNTVMSKNGIREDRLVGPWFVKEHEFLENGSIPGKVLVYLWDDLFRNHDKSVVFNFAGTTYGSLVSAVEAEQRIFSTEFLAELTDNLDD